MNDITEEESRDAQCYTNIRAYDDLRAWRSAIKPWSEFFRLKQFGLPHCISGYIKRLKKNFAYFLANYMFVTLISLLCAIITSFWLLISSIILAILIYLIYRKTKNGPLRVGHEEIPTWILYFAAIFVALPLFIFADVGYVLYCAAGISVMVTLLHASFHLDEPPPLPEVTVQVLSEINNTPRMGAVEIVTPNRDFARKTRVHFDDLDDVDVIDG